MVYRGKSYKNVWWLGVPPSMKTPFSKCYWSSPQRTVRWWVGHESWMSCVDNSVESRLNGWISRDSSSIVGSWALKIFWPFDSICEQFQQFSFIKAICSKRTTVVSTLNPAQSGRKVGQLGSATAAFGRSRRPSGDNTLGPLFWARQGETVFQHISTTKGVKPTKMWFMIGFIGIMWDWTWPLSTKTYGIHMIHQHRMCS